MAQARAAGIAIRTARGARGHRIAGDRRATIARGCGERTGSLRVTGRRRDARRCTGRGRGRHR